MLKVGAVLKTRPNLAAVHPIPRPIQGIFSNSKALNKLQALFQDTYKFKK